MKDVFVFHHVRCETLEFEGSQNHLLSAPSAKNEDCTKINLEVRTSDF